MASSATPEPSPAPLRIPAADLVRRPVDRRAFLNWTARSTLAGLTLTGAFGPLVACGGGGQGDDEAGGGELPGRLKVGVIVPTSGLGQFLGEIVTRSLGASKRHIEEEGLVPGTTVDYEIVDAPVEQFAEGTQQAYNVLVADPDVIGILWCTPLGLTEAMPQIQRDQMPVIAVYADPWSADALDPAGSGRTIFQMLLPDRMSLDALCAYAADDRDYATTGLIYDTSLNLEVRSWFERAAGDHGLEVAGVEEFQITTGDYGAQLQRLKAVAPECLFVWGLSDNTAQIVQGLADLGSEYVDTPTARRGDGWHPQILGYPGGTGEKKWAELAGDAAKVGTITAWYLGGLIGGPQFPVRDWLIDYDGHGASGGEEGAANGWWALLEAVRSAGTTDRARVVEALTGLRTRFAGLPFELDADTHLSISPDEVCLISLERWDGPVPTEPPYVLGREWETTFPTIQPDYVGPAHLLRPTLEANRRAQPDYIAQLLEEGWGTQCTKTPPDALGEEVEMTPDCRIH